MKDIVIYDLHDTAELLHNIYEDEAVKEGWKTQEVTRVKFDDLPVENQRTMYKTVLRFMQYISDITVQPFEQGLSRKKVREAILNRTVTSDMLDLLKELKL